MELEEAPSDDRDGTRSASSADHGGVAGHIDRGGVARPHRAGASVWGAPVRRAGPRGGAGGGAGGDDRLAIRRGERASGRAGGDGGAAGKEEACEERSR